jgi:hypothetical protein
VCYCLHVYKSDKSLCAVADGDGGSSEDTESEVTDDSRDESDNSNNTDAATTKDVLYDARKLFP